MRVSRIVLVSVIGAAAVATVLVAAFSLRGTRDRTETTEATVSGSTAERSDRESAVGHTPADTPAERERTLKARQMLAEIGRAHV